MRRRDFIAGLGSAAAWPVVAGAQQPAVPVVGFLNSGSQDRYRLLLDAFRQGLKDGGYGRAETSQSRVAGRRVVSLGYRSWQPVWFVSGCP
jgi:hypothetical protein